MGADTLAQRISGGNRYPHLIARELLEAHRKTFKAFWPGRVSIKIMPCSKDSYRLPSDGIYTSVARPIRDLCETVARQSGWECGDKEDGFEAVAAR